MYVVTGITGQVGGTLAHTLLKAKLPVRAVMRNRDKAEPLVKLGCEIAIADINDTNALTTAFKGAEGVFIMVPPNFDPLVGFPEAHTLAATLKSAVQEARPGRVVYLSTIGAEAVQENLLTQHTIIEKELSTLPVPVTFLRPGWFMENLSSDIPAAREKGIVPSFLQPLDRQFPMIATADIGRVAAELLQEKWNGQRVVELEGPYRLSPNDIAATLTKVVGHPVKMEAVPRETWEPLFKAQGMKNPIPRIRMLDGFNEGWIDFKGGKALKGKVTLEEVLQTLTH